MLKYSYNNIAYTQQWSQPFFAYFIDLFRSDQA